VIVLYPNSMRMRHLLQSVFVLNTTYICTHTHTHKSLETTVVHTYYIKQQHSRQERERVTERRARGERERERGGGEKNMMTSKDQQNSTQRREVERRQYKQM